MTLVDLVVALIGGALMAGELWVFLAPRANLGRSSTSDVQEVKVVVKGEFRPDVILVEAGRPVRLLFYRDETAERSSQVVFDRLNLSQPLPPFVTTSVEFLPSETGDYSFQCGETIRGLVAAQVGGEVARSNLGRGHMKHG